MSDKIKVSTVLNKEYFKKPFEFGWKREVVYRHDSSNKAEIFYIDPSGKKIHTKRDVMAVMDDDLEIEMFSFAKKPLGFDEEVVRLASKRGFRTSDERVFGEVTSNNQSPTNVLVEHELLQCATAGATWNRSKAVDKSME